MPRALRIEYPGGAIYHPPSRKAASDRRHEPGRRSKVDARKIWIARRLRVETAVTLKWIAAELHMGTWTHVGNRLQNTKDKGKSTNQHELGFV
jgi:hypothetical protein